MSKAIFTRSEYQVVCVFLSLSFRQAQEEGESGVEGKTFWCKQPCQCWQCGMLLFHKKKVGNCKWWLYVSDSYSQKMNRTWWKKVRTGGTHTLSLTFTHRHCPHGGGTGLWLHRPVKLGDCGISIVRFVLAWSIWGNSSVRPLPPTSHPPARVCLRRRANMMYEAVCRGWAMKNGALHHLASHCQTRPRHYTSQKYRAHPRLSNFAICWQCLHGGWFVITNSRAKINKLIYDPSCICTMKMPLVT